MAKKKIVTDEPTQVKPELAQAETPAPEKAPDKMGDEPKPAQAMMIGIETLEQYNERLMKRSVKEGIATLEFMMHVPMTVYIRDAINQKGIKVNQMQAFHVQPGQYIQVGSSNARDYLLRLTLTDTGKGRAKENYQVPMFEVLTDTLPKEDMYTNPLYIQR